MTVFADSSGFIMDLGMHNGDDTAYYLAKGFEVVAIEPNPSRVQAARARFAHAIAAGQLTLVEAALWSHRDTLPFYINDTDDRWSSLDPERASHDGAPARAIKVTTLTLSDLFDRFGTPLYIKIDVEGAEKIVLEQLSSQLVKPLYVSVANDAAGFDLVAPLLACGYDGFQLLDQSQVATLSDPDLDYAFPEGSSGPFGNALPGSWLTAEEFQAEQGEGECLAPAPGRFDIHATRL